MLNNQESKQLLFFAIWHIILMTVSAQDIPGSNGRHSFSDRHTRAVL